MKEPEADAKNILKSRELLYRLMIRYAIFNLNFNIMIFYSIQWNISSIVWI